MNRSTRFRLALCLALLASLGYPATSAAVTFGSPTDYPVGTSPAAVVVGDFNGDGKMDMAVANSGSNFVSILLGNGDGTFQPAVNVDVGNPQTSIAVGDFNGDGKLDLLINSGPNTNGSQNGVVSILLGNGDGTFKPPVQIHSYPNNVAIAVGDFNRDGKLDFVVAEPQFVPSDPAPFLAVFLGNGDGTFQTPTDYPLPANSIILVGDFNGDGKPDIVAAGNGLVNVFLGVGDGTFPAPVVTGFRNPIISSLAAGDFNGDHKLDLVVANGFSRCRVRPCSVASTSTILSGNGDGTFSIGTTLETRTTTSTTFVAVGDFKGDGKLDVAVGGFNGEPVNLHLGKGDGTFPVLVPSVSSSSFSGAVAVDLNGDNLADMILLQPGPFVTILVNTSPASGADLSVGLTSTANPAVVGQNAGFNFQVTNLGPQDATGVVLTVDLPANTTFVSATSSSGSCTAAALTVTCGFSSLVSADSASAAITLTPTAPGMGTISASVAANQADLVPANNMASDTFTVIPTFTLTVMKAGAGGGTVADNLSMIHCGTSCAGTYASDTNVALQASADPTSAFASWSGACAGTDPNSCIIAMTSDMTVTATFVPGASLTVSVAGTGAGTVTSTPPGINCSGPNCMANFAANSTVNLKASASSGSFASWSGACTGTDPNACVVSMSAAQSVTATFSLPPDFSLSLSAVEGVPSGGQVPDTITLNPQNGAFNATVSFTCSVSPALAECSFSPSSLTLGATPVTTTLNLVALKPNGVASLAPPQFSVFASLWLPIPGLLFAGLGFGSKQSRKKKLFAGVLLLCLLCGGMLSQSGCGGGGSSSSSGGNSNFTPPGQYNVMINATSGAVAHSATVTLNVQ